jgi:hypothetical protein
MGRMLRNPPVELSLLGFCRARYGISLDDVVPKRFDLTRNTSLVSEINELREFREYWQEY